MTEYKNSLREQTNKTKSGKVMPLYSRSGTISPEGLRFLAWPNLDNSGAASVLVIFLMLVFVTLGAFAITSANANYKLSQRAKEWNEMYYSLDAMGEEYVARIDKELSKAEEMAYVYFDEGKYRQPADSDIPEGMQADIYRDYVTGAFQPEKTINNIYMHYANIYLNSLANSVLEVYTIENGNYTDSVFAQVNFKSDRKGNEDCGLNISVWVEPVEYKVSSLNGRLVAERANASLRYKVEDWYEYQESADEEETQTELWDGSF